ncbi:FliC/FljB family flagellin [Escherichia fergusonii]|uniref:FliC/FljB family flagellin n=1 Tax=Escherichia fergusonii TaxID=564 RepID=UPI0015E93A15|nr:FliC/FljB family flagellin [Escherichia fergusonii]QME62947.1 FliC/FljB family flagellin [Escherichia fergusonii]QME67557.1 FliC/FljB family flagellin [Escherichia fergusonii]QME99214.1 FliC/FljB family flagellin [Escherichia fergusonii]
MAQVINTNSLSLLTQNNLNKSQSSLSSAIERLSSGLRINSAKDDAAGQAIANRFTANIKGLTQASRNANDGISIAQTTEGALNEITNNLQRVRELSVQAANGTNSDSDLKSIQDEIDQRLTEINRVAEQTDFNGTKVLSKDGKLTIQVGANDNETISIDLKKIDSSTLGLDKLDVTKMGNTVSGGTSLNVSVAFKEAMLTDLGGAATTGGKLQTDDTGKSFVTIGGKSYEAKVDNTNGTVTFDSKGATHTVSGTAKDVKTVGKTVKFDNSTGFGINDDLVKYKDDKGNDAYAIRNTDAVTGRSTYKTAVFADDGTVTAGTIVTPDITVNPLEKIDAALSDVDKFRSQLGAVQNRFDSAITNLGNTVNNLSSARSRIEDADYATEVSNMSRAQILQQAGTSVLAQANQTTQNVLSLLR